MHLDARGDLAAAQLAFYIPAILLSLVVTVRHGFSHFDGWLYLVILSILRLISASIELYVETQNDFSLGLIETAAITSAVGTAPLLLVLLGILRRVNAVMSEHGIQPSAFLAVFIVSIGGLVLAIIGGTFESDSDPGASKAHTGMQLFEAGALLFFAVYVSDALFSILTAFRKRYVPASEKVLVVAGVAVLPFLLVRSIFTVIIAFASAGSKFYYRDLDVYYEAFLMFLMEAIAMIIYISAGLLTPRKIKQQKSYERGQQLLDIRIPNK